MLPTAHVRQLALENLPQTGVHNEQQIGRAVLAALSQAGVDLKSGPSLEEMKALLADVARLARHGLAREHTAA